MGLAAESFKVGGSIAVRGTVARFSELFSRVAVAISTERAGETVVRTVVLGFGSAADAISTEVGTIAVFLTGNFILTLRFTGAIVTESTV